MQVRIARVDMDSFLNRIHHPTKIDIGQVGSVYRIFSELYDNLTPVEADLIGEVPEEYAELRNPYLVIFYDLVMADGTLRTMFEDEIERI